MIFSHLNQPSSLVFNLQEIAPLNDLPRNSTTNHKTTGTAHLLRPASLATITRRGMKKLSLESGRKIAKAASDQLKYYVNVAIENRALGHEVNRVTLLTPHEAQAEKLSGSDPRKTLAKLFRSDNWDRLTPNGKKGQLGEDLAKTINEAIAQKQGWLLKQQPPKGVHPSSNKGSDLTRLEEKFLGPSSDQSTLEFGHKIVGTEVKTTSGKMSETSLNRLVEKNKAVQQIAQKEGQYYEDLQNFRAEEISQAVEEGKNVVITETATESVGVASASFHSTKAAIPVTDEQLIVEAGTSLDQILDSFDSPESSDYVQTTDVS